MATTSWSGETSPARWNWPAAAAWSPLPPRRPLSSTFSWCPAPSTPARQRGIDPEDLDLDYYTGEIVDLESLLREQIILMMPLKPLCDETCKGLCPHCGANLNHETCTCATDAVNSPFAQLAKLKI